jgi:hypothetical protein
MRIVEKGWGREEIWADEPGYCGKNMVFEAGKRFSMHFHRTKDETWLIQSGEFTLLWIDATDASEHEMTLLPATHGATRLSFHTSSSAAKQGPWSKYRPSTTLTTTTAYAPETASDEVLGLGDACRDVYISGDSTRKNPEAAAPLLNNLVTEVRDGMAANVANNLRALGRRCHNNPAARTVDREGTLYRRASWDTITARGLRPSE